MAELGFEPRWPVFLSPVPPNLNHPFFLKKNNLFLAVLALHCCEGFSLVSVSGGYSSVAVPGLLIEVASLVEHRL